MGTGVLIMRQKGHCDGSAYESKSEVCEPQKRLERQFYLHEISVKFAPHKHYSLMRKT
jgi:hypothetical protein